MSIQNVLIIGSGTMGTGIAQSVASHGYNVQLYDNNKDNLSKAISQLTKTLEKLKQKDKITELELNKTLNNIQPIQNYNEVKDVDLIIEAASEKVEVKKIIFKELKDLINENTLVASNTSSISITTLANSVTYPQNFVGIHFFNPVPLMKLVEVVRGLKTSEETILKAKEFALSLEKEPIVSKDSPGFIVNRLLDPMLNEAFFLLENNIASAEDIDKAMKYGCNHPMGPLELTDLVGADILLNVMNVLHEEMGDSKYRPSVLLKRKVDANELGRKTKKGIYDY